MSALFVRNQRLAYGTNNAPPYFFCHFGNHLLYLA
ncbi:hypothetical protein OOU_Y34scaffold01171g4 [Pyricularia oryzae Y34]|uniref:Uncharacterized protein n=1 Tax=Pyricularia oryzae (strain Y34) TaxID=1143189 RepID=A0AA97NLM6_PYRO3|nr:hypothetical protein OOU_Y34scaffold01171g4 [Pyricularia oryzae Y34]